MIIVLIHQILVNHINRPNRGHLFLGWAHLRWPQNGSRASLKPLFTKWSNPHFMHLEDITCDPWGDVICPNVLKRAITGGYKGCCQMGSTQMMIYVHAPSRCINGLFNALHVIVPCDARWDATSSNHITESTRMIRTCDISWPAYLMMRLFDA